MKTVSSVVVALSLAAMAAACGTASEAAPPAPQSKPSSTASADANEVCLQTMAKSYQCTDQYIPALVDLRAKKNHPEGIADKVKADRDGVIARAKEEWKADSSDDAIRANCQRMAAAVDPSDVQTAQRCVAQPECGAFVSCIMPVMDKHL